MPGRDADLTRNTNIFTRITRFCVGGRSASRGPRRSDGGRWPDPARPSQVRPIPVDRWTDHTTGGVQMRSPWQRARERHEADAEVCAENARWLLEVAARAEERGDREDRRRARLRRVRRPA